MNTTTSATTVAGTADLASRVAILRAAVRQMPNGADSVEVCAEEAAACLAYAAEGRQHPRGKKGTHATAWVGSGLAWAERGARHLWGFTRPEGW